MRGNTLLHRDWLAFDEARHKMRWKWHAFFEEWDLLLCPPAASAAFPHDQQGERHERTIRVNGKDVPTTDQLFWAGYPGDGVPARDGGADRLHAVRDCRWASRSSARNTPTARTIDFARHLEREYQAFVPPPGYE